MTKRILALCFTLALLLAAGCGSAPAASPDSPEPGKNRGTVRAIFCEDAPTTDYVDNQLPAFMEASGITVEADVLPAASFYEKMTLGMATDNQDWDLCQIDVSSAGPLLAGGYLLPLDDYMRSASPAWSKGYEDTNVLHSFAYQEQHYGIPQFMGTCILMYNARHFTEAGLDPDQPPKTLDELTAACRVLNKPEEGRNAIAFRASREGATCSYFWSMLYFNQGGSWYPKDAPALAVFDTPAARAAAGYFVELGNYAPEGIVNYSYPDCYAAIQQGKVSMLVDVSQCASWTIDPELSATAEDMRFSAFDGHCLAGNWNFSIGAGSQAPELAWEVVEYLTGYEVSWAECESLKLAAPCRTDILNDPRLGGIYPESLITAMRESQQDCDAIFYPIEPQCEEIVTALAIHLNDALAGAITAEEAMEKTQKEVLAIKARDGLR